MAKMLDQYQKLFLPVAKYWLKEVDFYGEVQFQKKTPVSEWSIGQVYQHIASDTFLYHKRKIEQCIQKVGGETRGSKNFIGFFSFLFGKIIVKKVKPTGKLKDYVPEQPKNPEAGKDLMFYYIKEMKKLAELIDAHKIDLKYKVKHPLAGMLNAHEWYMMLIFHQKHHISQKKRIDAVLRKFDKDEVFDNPAPIV